MQVTSDSLDEESLVSFGLEAARLVVANDLSSLHQSFGYALAFAREPVAALTEDLAATLAELEATSLSGSAPLEVSVKHYQPNDTGLLSVVECLLATNNRREVLLELVVTEGGSGFHVTLEQFSACTVARTPNAASQETPDS